MLINNQNVTMLDCLKNSIANADEIMMNVAFIRDSGLKKLIEPLAEAQQSGKSVKILTSDYMNVTEPNALYRLADYSGVRLFDNPKRSFHPKTYIFKTGENYQVFIGSSNISYSALVSGVEWNYTFTGKKDDETIKQFLDEFDKLYENSSFELSLEWLRNYEKKYVKTDLVKLVDSDNGKDAIIEAPAETDVEPIKFQIGALYELSKTREEGFNKAMVVVGTGLGKTYLSAFDSMSFNKVLFVAHRDEILQSTYKSYQTVYKNTKTYGFFNASDKNISSDIVFASIQTLGKKEYLNETYFSKDYFDYIVIDEFHHAEAQTYKKVLDYFTPKFLLGLTATPDRADNGDVYKLCDYNIAYECDFKVGINNGWLVPFEYFGIYDDTDYETIPWRSGKYDLEKLENALILQKRMELIFQKYSQYRKKSTIAFCAGIKHCKAMYTFFTAKEVTCAMILGETPLTERQNLMSDFKEGKISILFTVDVFNEGVDIPCIDTVMFLRPTNSYTIFIQQLGRGLRTYEGKEKLRVIDFVGNYKGAELRPCFLAGNPKKSVNPISEDLKLPQGCTANFDFEIIDYFAKKQQEKTPIELKLKESFQKVKNYIGKRPSMIDIFTYGEIPVHTYLQKYKSWYNFLETVEELTEEEKKYPQIVKDFLIFIEKTSMTKSYKISLLLTLFQELLKESVTLEEIGYFYKTFYDDEVHAKDLTNKKHENWREWEVQKFMKLANDYPIKFLLENKESNPFFVFKDNTFILEHELYLEIRKDPNILNEIRDRLEYRNKNYFNRKYRTDDDN